MKRKTKTILLEKNVGGGGRLGVDMLRRHGGGVRLNN